MKHKRKLTAIELFCGAGGTSFGLEEAGFEVRVGVDIDDAALASFEANHPDARAIHASVTDTDVVNGDTLREAAGTDEIDLLVGGPSCQGYSTIGKRIAADPRNVLFVEYIRLVRELKPRWLLFENVKGMLIAQKGEFLEQFKRELVGLGYDLEVGVVNAADYGVPQRRQRLIAIGSRVGIRPTLPPPTHADPRCGVCSQPDASNRVRAAEAGSLFARGGCQACGGWGVAPSAPKGRKAWVSVHDAIGDLPVLGDSGGTDDSTPYATPGFSAYQKRMRRSSRGYTLHAAKPVSEYAYEIISRVTEGKGLRSIPEEHLPDRFRSMRKVSDGSLRRDCTTLYHRLDRSLPSYTITCYFTNVSSGAFVHPIADRAITPREAARLQSFPDRFQFCPKSVKRQIGNAVPPLLATAIGEHIRELDQSLQLMPLKENRSVSAKDGHRHSLTTQSG